MRFYQIGLCLLLAVLLSVTGFAGSVSQALAESSSPSSSIPAMSMHQPLEHPDIELDVTVGYDGLITYGKTMPILIRIENNGADLNGTIAVNIYADYTQYNRYELDLDLAQGATKELLLPVYIGNKQETFTVELWQGDQKLCATSAVPDQLVNPSAKLIGVLSPEPQTLSYMTITAETDELLRGEYLQVIPLTERTFPSDISLLNSFSILVVDGFDVRALSDVQKEVLQHWLESGRILIVGGGTEASTTYPYFSALTGILPGEILQDTDITPTLLSYLQLNTEPLGQEVVRTAGTGGEVLIGDAETPLIWRTDVGRGSIYTTAFELGAKPLSTWPMMHTFWQRLFIQDNSDLYYNSYSEYDNYDSLSYESSRIPMENDGMLWPAVIAIAVFAAIAGPIAYLLLKRLDKRQLLWMILPILTIVSTVVVCLIATSSEINQPTVLSVSVLSQNASGAHTLGTSLAVATPEKGEHLLTLEEGSLMPTRDYDYDYYYYTDENMPIEPTRLRYRYVYGDQTGIGQDFGAPWNIKYFTVLDLIPPQGNLESSLWMEEDGIHGYIINNTGFDLTEGAVIGTFGYSSVPALKNGERHEVTMLKATFDDPLQPIYKDGFMYESFNSSLYSIIDEYFYQSSLPEEERELKWGRETSQRYSMAEVAVTNNVDNHSLYNASGARFHYFAFNDALVDLNISLDGKAIPYMNSRGVVSAAMNFDSIGQTGIVYRIPGMDMAIRCFIDADGAPYLQSEALSAPTSYQYYRLSERPTFVFTFAELGDIAIDRLIIHSNYASSLVRMFLYDGTTWVEHKLGEAISQPESYIDAEGRLYVQFRTDSVSEYEEVYTPTLQLEGRVK